jgi:hypothetical protein
LLGELLAIRYLDHTPALAYLAHLRPQEPHESLLGETLPHPLERTPLLAHCYFVLLAPMRLYGCQQRTRYSSTVPRTSIYSLTRLEEVFSETGLPVLAVLG